MYSNGKRVSAKRGPLSRGQENQYLLTQNYVAANNLFLNTKNVSEKPLATTKELLLYILYRLSIVREFREKEESSRKNLDINNVVDGYIMQIEYKELFSYLKPFTSRINKLRSNYLNYLLLIIKIKSIALVFFLLNIEIFSRESKVLL